MELSEAPVMEVVKPGYRRTESGLIPEAWESSRIGDYAYVTKLAGFEYTLHFDYSKSGPIIAVRALNIRGGRLHLEDVHTIPQRTSDILSRSKLTKGDLVISYVGTLGRVAVIPAENKYHLAPNVAKISVDTRTIHPEYLCQYLNGHVGQRNIFEAAASTTQAALSMRNLRGIFFARPPIPEQRAIATALSDVDDLLGCLDALIAKKKAIKQGAMQQLLTGKQRLKGFEGEWVAKRLGEIAAVTKGEQLGRSSSAPNGNYPHLNGGMTPSGYSEAWNTEANTIAISEGGNSCGYVQFMTTRYWNGGHCYAVRPSGVDNRFLYHMLKGNEPAIMALRVGSGLPNVQKTAILELQLTFPSCATEQTAIAEMLSDMDAEIGALEARRAKTALLKQGMMQELLTGRTRLV